MQQTPFTSPGYDYSADVSAIERRKQIAQALQAQSMQPMEQQPVGQGQFATQISPWQGAAKLAQAFAANRQGKKAEDQQRQLSQKSQADYQKMIATGLRQMQGTPGTPLSEDASGNVTPAQPAVAPDPAAAMGTFGSHPMGQAMAPMAMQEMQRQRLIEALRGSQGAPQAAAGGTAAPSYGSPGFAPGQPQGPSGGGPNMNLHLLTDPSGKSYVHALEQSSETQGRVSYDQEGNAFTVGKDGRVIRLQGIKHRDELKPINTGGETQFVNLYNQTQPIQHSITPQNRIENYWHMGLGQPPQQGGGMAPGGAQPMPQQPQAGMPQQAPQPVPGAPQPLRPTPVQAPPGNTITPEQRAKIEAARPQQTQATTGALNNLQNSLNEISRLEKQPGLSNITGPTMGRLPNIRGEATNAQANLDTLKSQVGVEMLQAMRDASKTGGAVGQVTEKEWPILQNQFGALQQSQTTAEFRKNLKTVRGTMERMQANIRQAHESTYGPLKWEPAGGGQPEPLSAQEQQELEQLRQRHGRR